MPPRPSKSKHPFNQSFANSDISMHTPGQSIMDSDVTMMSATGTILPSGTPMDVDVTMLDASSYKGSSAYKKTPTKPHPKEDPIPFPPLSPAKPALELGPNRDDVSGARFAQFEKAIEKQCDTCGTILHKAVLQTRLEKACEPAGLSDNTAQGFSSSTRRPRPELRFQRLQETIQKFISIVLPDPEVAKEREKHIKAQFHPKTPKFAGFKIKPRGAKELVPIQKLNELIQNRLCTWSYSHWLVPLWGSELIQHRWAILSAWIWHYFQDSHFLSSRTLWREGVDDIEEPVEFFNMKPRNKEHDDPFPRSAELDGVGPPLPVRPKAHRAWNTLLEEFAPHRNYPGTNTAPGVPRTREEEQFENYSVAYEAWRKATQTLMSRATLTSEFPFSAGHVVPHILTYISHLFHPEDFPKDWILHFASAYLRHQYTGDPTFIPNPYDQPSQEVLDEIWVREVAMALCDVVDAAIDFRNEKDRDSRAWEVTFKPPPTAKNFETEKKDYPYNFNFDESIMKVIADSRPAASIFTNMAPPPSPPSSKKGKGKEKAKAKPALVPGGERPTVALVATPLLYENRSVRSGYTAFDRYYFNNLEVILAKPVLKLDEYKAILAERAQWVAYRDGEDDDEDDDEEMEDDEDYDDPNDQTYQDSGSEGGIAPSTAKKKGKGKGKATDVTPPTGTKRKQESGEGGGTTKRRKKDGDADVAQAGKAPSSSPGKVHSSPTVGVAARRARRRAAREAERIATEQRERAERLERLRDERERTNEQRVQRGLQPLPDIDDDELLRENERPRFFRGWI